MNELVYNQNGATLTTSILVAQKFEKRHSDVIRAIDTLLSANAKLRSLFVSSTYTDEQLKGRLMYVMNRDGFTLLAMGFTGKKAINFKLEYIEAFNKMEEKLRHAAFSIPETLSDALFLAAKQAKEIEEKNNLIEEQSEKIAADQPKVLFADAVTASKNSCLIGELAKIITQNGYTIGQNRLFIWMRENGYLCKSGERYNQPMQRYVEQGLFEVKKITVNQPDRDPFQTTTTKVTGKGQIYFVNLFVKNNQLTA